MAKVKRNDYFALLTEQAAFCVQAAQLLEHSIEQFDADQTNTVHQQMHTIEHNADLLHHDILKRLYTEFITPIDQDDILRLVQIIDDVTDALDEVTMDFSMYNIRTLPKGTDTFAKLVTTCVKSLHAAVAELKNFKKPEQLRAHIIEMNNAEAEADAIYTDAIHALFTGNNTDAATLISSHKVLDSLENCCDLCEHAADVIEQIIIGNT